MRTGHRRGQHLRITPHNRVGTHRPRAKTIIPRTQHALLQRYHVSSSSSRPQQQGEGKGRGRRGGERHLSTVVPYHVPYDMLLRLGRWLQPASRLYRSVIRCPSPILAPSAASLSSEGTIAMTAVSLMYRPLIVPKKFRFDTLGCIFGTATRATRLRRELFGLGRRLGPRPTSHRLCMTFTESPSWSQLWELLFTPTGRGRGFG